MSDCQGAQAYRNSSETLSTPPQRGKHPVTPQSFQRRYETPFPLTKAISNRTFWETFCTRLVNHTKGYCQAPCFGAEGDTTAPVWIMQLLHGRRGRRKSLLTLLTGELGMSMPCGTGVSHNNKSSSHRENLPPTGHNFKNLDLPQPFTVCIIIIPISQMRKPRHR